MTHVVFVCPGLGVGGGERHLIRYANGLVERNQRITIVVIGSHFALAEELSPRIVVHKLDSRFRNPYGWWRLRSLLKQLLPDIVFGWSTYSNFIACIALWNIKTKFIVSEINYPPIEYRVNGALLYLILKMVTKVLYRRADVVTANSDASLEILRQWVGPGPGYVRLFNPVDYDKISKLADEAIVEPAIASNMTVILAVGRIELQHKGFDVLFNALANLKQHDQIWKCVVVGHGPDEESLRKQAQALGINDRIVWCGQQNNPFPYFKRADIFVLSSRREGFPNALLEAMSLGKAVVATDCMTGPREMTDNGRCGRLVAVDDAEALSKAIAGLLENSHERRRLGVLAKQWIADTYTDEKVFDRLMSVL